MQKQWPNGIVLKFVLVNFAKFKGRHICRSLFFNNVAGLKPTSLLKNVFFCSCCEIFKSSFLNRTPRVAASENANNFIIRDYKKYI